MIGGSSKEILKALKLIFPTLKKESHKGQNGRIGIIGGSFEFTGAPYYSAISSLKVGADLAHIFCSKSSSSGIKSYSPEIIVHPLFVSDEEISCTQEETQIMITDWVRKIKTWEKAIHSWVIGPGLGRDKYMNQFFPVLVKNLPEGCIVVFDADGIYYLTQHPELFQQLKRYKTILTPNLRQLMLLQDHLKIDISEILKENISSEEIIQVSNKYSFPGFKILIKGQNDIILGNDESFIVNTKGGLKRCGGMGDILAGVVAACSFWNFEKGPVLASRIVRTATRLAFQKQGRGLTAPGVIEALSRAVKKIQQEEL